MRSIAELTRRWWILIALSVASAASSASDKPMQFRFETVGKTRVLWLEGGIGPGSAAHVSTALNQTSRYDEVWLNSGGGLVSDGFEIGRRLRSLKATVRVPNLDKVRCASSCTNLMLGGYNRIVDEGARFYVHAKSGVLEITETSEALIVTDLNRGKWQRSPHRKGTYGELAAAAANNLKVFRDTLEVQQKFEVESAVEMVKYFHEIVGGTPNLNLYKQISESELPLLYGDQSPWIGTRDLSQDAASVRADGLVGLQEVLTQIELQSMRAMLSVLRARAADLGRGAKVATRLFEATLACRIQDLCLLTQHQLANLGYHNFDRD